MVSKIVNYLLDLEKKGVEKSRGELYKFNNLAKQVNASTDLNEIVGMVFKHFEKEFSIEAVILQLIYHEK